MRDPWYKATFQYDIFGKRLSMHIPHDVFSTQRIDEGTLLLLENLPDSKPKSILDMGCGYGALGLPIAAIHPETHVDLVDRDLLAVEWSKKNAAANSLGNVNAFGSLGFRDVRGKYDWILCNVPARIGEPFIKNLIHHGCARLNPGGELRVVVINDLIPFVNEMKLIATGPRHSIFAIRAEETAGEAIAPEKLYLRDQVKVADLTLDRPFDLGGDDQKRLKTGLPVLIDALPRKIPGGEFKVLCFRAGYGQIPLIARKRWADAKVVAVDRDLLGTTFIHHNAEVLGLEGNRLEVRENAFLPFALGAEEKFNLILGELSPSAGESVAISELETIEDHLIKGGEALILCLEKYEKDWIKKFAGQSKLSVFKVLSREGYTVVRLSKV
jgi:16S rRNA (guanine1207-N2)-methyltransferase